MAGEEEKPTINRILKKWRRRKKNYLHKDDSKET